MIKIHVTFGQNDSQILEVSRVPCIGEHLTDDEGSRTWRVVAVGHVINAAANEIVAFVRVQ